MRYAKGRTLLPMMLLAALGASGCGERVRIQAAFPPAQDLAVEPKPVPPPEIVTSAQAAAEHNVRIEAWADRGWLQIARLCRWARENGMQGIVCPPAQ